MKGYTILFVVVLFFFNCAKKIEGSASAAFSPGAYETVTPMQPPPPSVPSPIPTPEVPLQIEEGEKYLWGVGASNLKPFIVLGYSTPDSGLGVAINGIPFSGLKIQYNMIGVDISYMKRTLGGTRSYLGLGLGGGGVYSEDYNFSEEGRRNEFFGGHGYGLMHLSHTPTASKINLFMNFRLGYYYFRSSYLKSVSKELSKTKPYIKEKDKFGGLFVVPAVGLPTRIIEEKISLIIEINTPLSAALLLEPDLHPFVPSFTFVFVY